ncbi:MAG: Dabb family protein [Chloroflexota bacterium]
MVRHVVMFKFKPEVDTQSRVDFVRSLQRLAEDIDVIRALEIGQNFTQSPRAADIVLIVDLDDEKALAEYSDHPDHIPVKDMAAHLCSESRVVDYVID